MIAPGLHYLKETPSQTAGPYVHIGLIPRQAGLRDLREGLRNVLAGPDAAGERIRIEGRVLDGTGEPLRDVLIEIWQANAAGSYDHPADRQDEAGRPALPRLGPGRLGFRDRRSTPSRRSSPARWSAARAIGLMAPHVNFWIVARGINIGLNTRMYFADEAEANAADPVLNLIEHPRRRETLSGRAQRRAGRRSSTPSTSACRASAKPCSSTSEP